MALVVPNGAEADMLAEVLAGAQTLRLFTNNVTPGETDTAASYTEASGNGYSAKAVTSGNWSITGTAPTDAAYPEQTFTFTGALGNVYGYYVTRDSDGKVRWAERFSDAPVNVQNNGDQIKVTLHFTLD